MEDIALATNQNLALATSMPSCAMALINRNGATKLARAWKYEAHNL